MNKNLKKYSQFLHERPKLKNGAIEISIVLVLVMAFFIQMTHMAADMRWLHLFLFDGDSLTLPMLFKSLEAREPLQWIFSPQLNLFPEAIIYGAAHLFAGSIQATIVINAFFNVILFYTLVRILIRSATNAPLLHRQLFGFLTMLCLFGFMLLEVPTAYGQTLVTYLLFSSYYSGAILAGILNICFISWLFKLKNPLKSRHFKPALISLILFNSLVIASNPLFVIQFTAPFTLATILMLLLKLTSIKIVAKVLIPLLCVPMVVGFTLRMTLLSNLIGKGIDNFSLTLANLVHGGPTVQLALNSITPTIAPAGLRIRIALSVFLFVACLLVLLPSLRIAKRQITTRLKPAPLFVIIFILFQPLVILFCLYVFNAGKERHLSAAPITAVIAIGLLAGTNVAKNHLKKFMSLAVLGSILIVLCFAININKKTPIGANPKNNQDCLNNVLPPNSYGVADFWVARQLDAYNTKNQRVLQVNEKLDIFTWLNNIDSYRNKDFTFYIYPNGDSLSLMHSQLGSAASEYSRAIQCDNFTIYQYDAETAGHTKLNKKIRESLEGIDRGHINQKP